jgi:hypothetical protein
MMRKGIAIVAIALISLAAIASCPSARAEGTERTSSASPLGGEPIGGIRFLEDGSLAIIVFTSGYSAKPDFALDFVDRDSYVELDVVRLSRDPGKMVPQPLELVWTRAELEGRYGFDKPIVLRNGIYADARPY